MIDKTHKKKKFKNKNKKFIKKLFKFLIILLFAFAYTVFIDTIYAFSYLSRFT